MHGPAVLYLSSAADTSTPHPLVTVPRSSLLLKEIMAPPCQRVHQAFLFRSHRLFPYRQIFSLGLEYMQHGGRVSLVPLLALHGCYTRSHKQRRCQTSVERFYFSKTRKTACILHHTSSTGWQSHGHKPLSNTIRSSLVL